MIIRSRYIPALWPIITYYGWPIKKWLKVASVGVTIHVFDQGHLTAIFEETERAPLVKKLLDVVKNKDLPALRKKGILSGRIVVRKLEALSRKAKKAEIKDFIPILDKVAGTYPLIMQDNMLYWLWISEPLERQIDEKLGGYKDDERIEIIQALSRPSEDSYSKKIEDNFDKLVSSARKLGLDSADVRKEIKKFSQKYYWFPFEYVGPGIWDEEALVKRIKENLNNDKPGEKGPGIKKKQEELVRKYKLSKEIIGLFKILQTLAIMQDDRKMFNSQACYFINGIILKDLAAKLGIPAQEAYYIDQELIESCLNNKAEFLRRIKERAEFFVAWQKDGEKRIYEGDSAKMFLRDQGINLQTGSDDIKEIVGQSANKGKYSGKVRVLKTSHIQNFLKGEILVAGMTTPDFAPIMKEAGAIITDEGGITCHAAIVSRELGIPCIIGTKIATKVLKDGDLVEVDADRGIVKILKQHGK